jgi:hypothetical protein
LLRKFHRQGIDIHKIYQLLVKQKFQDYLINLYAQSKDGNTLSAIKEYIDFLYYLLGNDVPKEAVSKLASIQLAEVMAYHPKLAQMYITHLKRLYVYDPFRLDFAKMETIFSRMIANRCKEATRDLLSLMIAGLQDGVESKIFVFVLSEYIESMFDVRLSLKYLYLLMELNERG